MSPMPELSLAAKYPPSLPYDQTEDEHEPQSEPVEPRTLVLCFDGTAKKLDHSSNVIRFLRALVKDRHHEQIVYYQPGVGTYHNTFITESLLDLAIGLHVDQHVKEGYRFLIESYHPGDKICLFGFSRGAHIARVLASMLSKVGILPKQNIRSQIDFAYEIYSTTGNQGYALGREFKQTYGLSVSVEFVGVWDSVSSIGIISQVHPYTAVNYGIKKFRHALALDERRTRFRPNVWNEVTPEREQEQDVDIPNLEELPLDTNRDDWTYIPPNRDFADVKEVWFAGCHADVGGGSHSTRRNQSLSFIPLRWMIKECILANIGILFDLEYLKESLDFDFKGLREEMEEKKIRLEDLGKGYEHLKEYDRDPIKQEVQAHHNSTTVLHHLRDIRDDIFDELTSAPVWWALEFFPTLITRQDPGGNWVCERRRNLGRGRYIPIHENEKILVHKSVKERINDLQISYTPKAYNWKAISPHIEYVK